MDQGFRDGRAPLIFGTVALDAEGHMWQDDERLAATEDAALLHHRQRMAELS